MELPGYARRMDGGRTGRVAHGTTAALAAAWRAPKQRRLALALAAAALSAIAFAHIAEDYVTNDPLARWDVTFARWLAGERTTFGVDFFRVLTFFGSPAVALTLAAVVCLALYRRGRVVEAALLPVVLGGAELLNLVLKLAFHRPPPRGRIRPHRHVFVPERPRDDLDRCLRRLRVSRVGSPLRTPSARLIMVAGTVLFVALIGFGRLYLGVHYLSDVLAGIAGGAFWLAVSIVLLTVYGDRFAARFAGSRADRLGQRLVRRRR